MRQQLVFSMSSFHPSPFVRQCWRWDLWRDELDLSQKRMGAGKHYHTFCKNNMMRYYIGIQISYESDIVYLHNHTDNGIFR